MHFESFALRVQILKMLSHTCTIYCFDILALQKYMAATSKNCDSRVIAPEWEKNAFSPNLTFLQKNVQNTL